ncbi:hypothetical protein [Paraburkholderia sp. J12]|uniref:hypothetical protein n=1 Tax=Paraburkholderia sp. J12 TaxID=2805432 RepID=UPI002ABE8832|nr:hypothetical protein [Paraburkholderia sp. J12]
MKLKSSFYGVVLFFTVASAYALDMRSSQPAAPASVAQPAATFNPAAVTNERIRQFLSQSGLDPDSDNGRLLVELFTRVATDAEFRNKFIKFSQSRGVFDEQLSPDDRMRMLHLFKDLAQGPKDDCTALSAHGSDFVLMAKTLSTPGYKDVLEITEILVGNSMPDSYDERYTTAELLDAEAQLESALESKLTPQLNAKGAPNLCEIMSASVDAIDAMPPASRQRATYEFFQTMANRPSARAKVLADPSAYLDDMFDERRLPDSIRRKLPENGSHPLPYSRLVIDAEWRHQSKPDKPSPFKDTFVNRRNNGVVAELIMPGGDSTKPDWSGFYLSYGFADLLTQNVGGELTQLGTLKDGTAVDVASQPLLEGNHIEFPVPLPSEEGETSKTCEVGKVVPASTVFKSLDGNAVELHCQFVKKDGNTERVNVALLVNYGIPWWTSYDDEDGHTDVVMKNVTIQQP